MYLLFILIRNKGIFSALNAVCCSSKTFLSIVLIKSIDVSLTSCIICLKFLDQFFIIFSPICNIRNSKVWRINTVIVTNNKWSHFRLKLFNRCWVGRTVFILIVKLLWANSWILVVRFCVLLFLEFNTISSYHQHIEYIHL